MAAPAAGGRRDRPFFTALSVSGCADVDENVYPGALERAPEPLKEQGPHVRDLFVRGGLGEVEEQEIARSGQGGQRRGQKPPGVVELGERFESELADMPFQLRRRGMFMGLAFDDPLLHFAHGMANAGFDRTFLLFSALGFLWGVVPFDVAFDRDGNLFLSDTFNHKIKRVDAKTGVVVAPTVGGLAAAGRF